MKISMWDLSEKKTKVLAGALSGREALSKMLGRTVKEPEEPEHVFLDFGDIEVATASYLRESILAFRDSVRHRHSNWYPVITSCNNLVEEELKVLVASKGNAMMLCSLDALGKPMEPRLVGELEPKQRVTFDLVRQRGVTDAAELMREHGESEKITVQTAWNNRLAALANLGLVVEMSQGRSKSYRPLFVED